MKFQGRPMRESKIDVHGNDMMAGPMGQLFALQMLGQKAQQGQGMATQAPQGMIPSGFQNQFGGTSVNPQAGATEEQFKDTMKHSETFGRAMNVVKVALPIMKGAYQQQAGQSGLIPGLVGQAAAKVGMDNTYDIASLKQAFNDIKANTAQQYSGNQGISKLMDTFGGAAPEPTDSEENALSKLHTLTKTIYGLAKGTASAGMTSQDLLNKNPEEVIQKIGDPHQYYTDEEGKAMESLIGEEYRNTEAKTLPNPQTGLREAIKPNTLNAGLKGITDFFGSGKKKESTIMMIGPDGHQRPVHTSKVGEATKRGYKMSPGA